MKSLRTLVFVVISVFNLTCTHAFYMTQKSRERSAAVQSVEIKYDSNDSGKFPKKFGIKFKERMINFIRIENDVNSPISSSNIYTVNADNQVVMFKTKNIYEDFEIYKEVNGDSFATLIQNQDYFINKAGHPFRTIASIHEKNSKIVYDIVPVVDEESAAYSDGRSLYKSTKNMHATIRRDDEMMKKIDYMIETKSRKKLEKTSSRNKRSNNGVPFELYMELMIIADYSIYQDHSRIAQSSDQNLVFLHMKAYFAHYVNGVNQRFQTSLSTDPDFRLTIKLKDYLFFQTESSSTWTSTQLHGVPGVPTFEGRSVVSASSVYSALISFGNSLSDFTFDHAIGFTSKDIWGDAGQSDRSGVTGFAAIGAMCQSSSYSLVEDRGGFSTIGVSAHEIGHNLNALHDGESGISAFCPASDNFLMTPGIGNFQNNLQNLLRFSSCSINAFKDYLLENGNSVVRERASCLKNVPANNALNVYIEDRLPGQAFTADDQCKMIFGSTASFCIFNSNIMCQSLACRKSDTETSCSFVFGVGAAEGTTCGSGMMCSAGECTTSTNAPVSTCPFGDDVVVNQQVIFNPLPATQLSCPAVFDFIINNLGQSPLTYCADERFKNTCCKTCARYESLTCVDLITNCAQFASACNTGAAINGQNINTVCPKTCNVCSNSQLTCNDITCQNGGTCTNVVPSSPNALDAFQCTCSPGFSGVTCEIVDQCSLSPCLNGGVCQNFGSLSYVCECVAGCSGVNCENCGNQPTTTTTTSTTTIASTPTTTTTASSTTTSTTTTISTSTATTASTSTSPQIENPCNSNPCMNGGSCVLTSSNSFQCTCLVGFTGLNCQTVVTPSNCNDQNSNCGFFAQSGYCSDRYSINGISLLQYCAVSCGTCETTSPPTTTTTSTTTTTTTTTTTQQPTNCVDRNSNCPYFASRGFCSNIYFIQGIPLPNYCAISCGRCTTPVPTTTRPPSHCIDRNSNCPYFASRGFCKSIYFIQGIPVPNYCAYSCNSCRTAYAKIIENKIVAHNGNLDDVINIKTGAVMWSRHENSNQ